MANDIFVGQGWTVTLDTNEDVSGATNTRIYYKKPVSGTITYKTATVVNTTELRVVFTASELDEAGDWLLHTYAEISGAPFYGDTFTRKIKNLYT